MSNQSFPVGQGTFAGALCAGVPVDLLFRQGSARPSEVIDRLSGLRHDPLVPFGAWRTFAAVAKDISFPVHTLFLECRLRGGVDRTDFGVGLFPGPEAARWAGELRARELGTDWRRVATFVEAWSRRQASWHAEIPFLFLAFDSDGCAVTRSAPCLSLCVDAHFHARRHDPDVPPVRGERALELLRLSHLELTGRQLGEGACARFLRLAGADGVELRHVSVMVPRPSSPVKLDLRLPLSQLSDYLQRQQWPKATVVSDLLHQLAPFGGYVQLNLPLEPYPARRLEVELFAGRAHATPEQRYRFLERIVERGLADRGKVDVLRGIHQAPIIDLGPGIVLGANFYVKLCFEEAELSEAKAYVGFMPKGLPPSRTQLGREQLP